MAERRPSRAPPPGTDARLFFELSPVAMLELDRAGVVRAANSAAASLWGRDVAGASLAELCSGLDPEVLAGLGSRPGSTVARVRAGVRHLDLVLYSVAQSDGIFACALDVSALVASERGASGQERLFAAVLDELDVGIVACDVQGRIVLFNRAARALYGAEEPPAMLTSWVEVCGLYAADGVRRLEPHEVPLCRALDGEEVRDAEIVINPAGGQPRRMLCSAGQIRDRDGTILGALTALHDVTQQRSMEEALLRRSMYDELTGLPNRVLFLDRLGTALAGSAEAGDTGVAVVGLDDFKVVNASLGHRAGDEVLAITADRLRGAIKRGDTVARLGGDEFGVILNKAGRAGALASLERLMSTFARPYSVTGRDIIVHASAGLELVVPGTTPAEALHRADLAMRAAKDRGKARFALFEPQFAVQAGDRLALQTELSRAVAEGRFVVLYQPIAALPSGRIVGAEALVRWRHDERGLIMPLDFIPLAEASGQIVAIGLQVLELACRQTAAWLEAGLVAKDFYVSVNLSPRQLLEEELVRHVRAVLSASGLQAKNLVLEITESALVGDVSAAIDRLAGLRNLGIRIAMDDFGTGYSSLGYLRRLPIDIVKIDRAFVSPITEGVEGAAVAKAIVRLAGALALETIAEGVETAEQAEALVSLGCASAQGFLYSPPAESSALASLFKRAHAG